MHLSWFWVNFGRVLYLNLIIKILNLLPKINDYIEVIEVLRLSGREFGLMAIKVGCVFLMVVVFILPHVELRRNDYREDAPHFILKPA